MTACRRRPALDDDRRFAILRRLLHDRELDLRDRFVGSVLLLYGKPITQIVALQDHCHQRRCRRADDAAARPRRDPVARAARRDRARAARQAARSGPGPTAGCCRAATPARTSPPTRSAAD